MAGHEVPPPAARRSDLDARVMIDVSDKANPAVLILFTDGDVTTTVRVKARAATAFGGQLGAAIMQAGQQALAATGPQLVTPTSAERLFVPGPGTAPGVRP